MGGCWVSLTGRFHRHSAAGWAECTVAGPGQVRRHAAQFSERSSNSLIGHARVAFDFDFCLSTSIPVLTTSTYVVAWPQGDQLLGGGPWHKANLPTAHWLSLPFHTPEDAWPQPQRRFSSFSHPICKYCRTSTPAPPSLRVPVVVCLPAV